ncbi:hypothetical protein [Amycolatopsis sacchari]|uniref:hypothetical protein n=1 Tax=Amycolatopsis sacchari TaxID=115433 RepID=UPI003D71B859
MGLFSWIGELIDGLQAPGRQRDERMRRAAGIGSIKLVCHRDTWETLDEWWAGLRSPRVPTDRVEPLDQGMVEVTLSGRNLVTLLNLTSQDRVTYEDRAVAKRVYAQVAKVVDAVDPDAEHGRSIPPIVLDDKLGDPSSRA